MTGLLLGAGAALAVVSAAIVRHQSRAAACPRHSRLAGSIAWILAAACAGGAVVLAWRGLALLAVA